MRDLRRIRQYLEAFNSAASLRTAQALLAAGDSLAALHRRGRPGSAPGTRELIAVRPYGLVYKVEQAEVVVVGVFTARRTAEGGGAPLQATTSMEPFNSPAPKLGFPH